MNKKVNATALPDFDMAKYLPDDEAIEEYLTIVLEENDPLCWPPHWAILPVFAV